MKNASSTEILDLADRYCAGLLSPLETQILNERLCDNAEAQRLFLSMATLNAHLRWEFAGIPAGNTRPVTRPVAVPARSIEKLESRLRIQWRTKATAAVAAVAAVVIYALMALNWGQKPASPVQERQAFAYLRKTLDAQWASGFEPGSESLFHSRLRLDKGLAEIEFRSGTIAILKAPVDFEITGGEEAYLHAGQVLVRGGRHDSHTTGFRMETPKSRMTDIGTEFGVDVNEAGSSLLQVYEGEVLATAKEGTSNTPRRVLEGQAVRLDDTCQEMAFWPERFVRLLPGPHDPLGRGVQPYNRSRFDSVKIVPANASVTIDGDLSDWDLSQRFRSLCEPPYSDNYFLEAAMMYDDKCLYIGAHVGDPHPMRSQISPQEPLDRHGMGGAVALRLSTDRRAGWPLHAESSNVRQMRPATPADLSEKLSFVVLWYFQPEKKACIHLRHGMDLRDTQVNPFGYQGSFRMDADGRGYTLEYAIPWRLLHAQNDLPRGGDELAAMWLVHWSDAHGRNWQGQLIDVTKPDESGWNFDRAATWGKAIYLPRFP